MFGISWAEFTVILLVAVVVIPARSWPDVARALARAVKMIRSVIWKITDASEQIKERLDLEAPINDIVDGTARDVLNEFSVPIKKKAHRKKTGKRKE